MDGQIAKRPVEKLIAGLAGRQHDVVARSQLTTMGIARGLIDARLRSGRWRLAYRGVYVTCLAPLTREGRFMAAVLACGEGAVLGHRSAAVLWGLRSREPAWIEVSVPGSRGRTLAGLLVHRTVLAEHETTIEDGIPVTTPGRTLIDLADVLNRRGLERAFDQAEYLRLDCAGLRVLPGRSGSGVLARVMAEHAPGSTVTRSELEERFLALCRLHQLPFPEVNVHVEGHLVDFVWRAERLIVETDGRRTHARSAAFETDRLRDAELVTAGWRVVRFTYRRLEREPAEVADQLASLLRGSP